MRGHQLILFNKPYLVLSQFTGPVQPGENAEPRHTLADYIPLKEVYPAGRLDYDSEGLLLLTDSGALQARIAEPRYKLAKHYWVQVEGEPDHKALQALRTGIKLKDGLTRPAATTLLDESPPLWEREPPVTDHRHRNSCWLNISLTEGKNRQVRRMCAAVGHPVLRLVRHRIGSWALDKLQPGEWKTVNVHLPQPKRSRTAASRENFNKFS